MEILYSFLILYVRSLEPQEIRLLDSVLRLGIKSRLVTSFSLHRFLQWEARPQGSLQLGQTITS